MATAWAAMRHMGVQGYQDSTKDIMRAVEAFKGVVKREPELDIMGEPASTVVAFTSTKKTFNIHQVCFHSHLAMLTYDLMAIICTCHRVASSQVLLTLHLFGTDLRKATLLRLRL